MPLEQGVTPAAEGFRDAPWNVVGHIYTPKLWSERVFSWHAMMPPGTFVPPHIHTTQDEWITMLAGTLEVDFEDGTVSAGPGDVIRMPMGQPHGIFNRSGAEVTCLFGVAPSAKLFELFQRLDGLTDPEELVRISAEHEVDFLPPPAG